MMDFIKQNDPQYLEYYIKVYGEKDPNDKRYKATNQTYLNRYVNYLREQADPGCLERERSIANRGEIVRCICNLKTEYIDLYTTIIKKAQEFDTDLMAKAV